MRTAVGNFTFVDQNLSMDAATIQSLFKLGIEMKRYKGRCLQNEGIRFGTTSAVKVANWIWCLLYEWAVENEDGSPIKYFVRVHRDRWNYAMACLTHVECGDEFSIPLALLGERAKIRLSAKIREDKRFSLDLSDVDITSTSFQLVLSYLSASDLAPRWAINDPYVSFPNFIPNISRVPQSNRLWNKGVGQHQTECRDPKMRGLGCVVDSIQVKMATLRYYEEAAEVDQCCER